MSKFKAVTQIALQNNEWNKTSADAQTCAKLIHTSNTQARMLQ